MRCCTFLGFALQILRVGLACSTLTLLFAREHKQFALAFGKLCLPSRVERDVCYRFTYGKICLVSVFVIISRVIVFLHMYVQQFIHDLVIDLH